MADRDVAYAVIVLKPTVAEIMRRMEARGRHGDLDDLARRRRDAEHQIRVLESDAMRTRTVLDTTQLSILETGQACVAVLGLFLR